jgi:hypothetical protein
MSNDTPRDTPTPDETQPVRPGEAALPPAPAAITPSASAAAPAAASDASAAAYEPGAATPPGGRGFRDRFRALRSSDGSRAFGLGALIASALAGVIVGGVGLTAVQAVTDDHRDGPGWGERHGPMGRDLDDDGRGPGLGGPGGMPGQLQPTPPPDEDSSEG